MSAIIPIDGNISVGVLNPFLVMVNGKTGEAYY